MARRSYHESVLVQEAVEHLRVRARGVYVDATCGGGGHARAILKDLSGGHLYAFDQDPDSAKHMEHLEQGVSFTMLVDNFRNIQPALAHLGVRRVDGVLADLGVSRHQIDTPKRGFSTRFEGPLDMRMNPAAPRTATQVLHTYSVQALRGLFRDHADLKEAHGLAKSIARVRVRQVIGSTFSLQRILKDFAPTGGEAKFFARIFQALRMEVNDEIAALKDLLRQCAALVGTGGRLVVISYHSCEDRLVKRFLRYGHFSETPSTNEYGHHEAVPFAPLLRTPITPSGREVTRNPAARSAKLRVGVRTHHPYSLGSSHHDRTQRVQNAE